MHLGHVLVCQDEVVAAPVHVTSNLGKQRFNHRQPLRRCRLAKPAAYLHEEPSQQSSRDAEGVGFGSKGRFRHGKLDPVKRVGQLGSNGVSFR